MQRKQMSNLPDILSLPGPPAVTHIRGLPDHLTEVLGLGLSPVKFLILIGIKIPRQSPKITRLSI
jgi:hypothetical protein